MKTKQKPLYLSIVMISAFLVFLSSCQTGSNPVRGPAEARQRAMAKEILSVLINEYQNKDACRSAVRALRNLGDPAIREITRALKDDDIMEESKVHMASSICGSSPAALDALPVLYDLIRSDGKIPSYQKTNLRSACIEAVGYIGPAGGEKSALVLKDVIASSKDKQLLQKALFSAAMLRKEARPLIPELVRVATWDSDSTSRSFAVNALGNIGHEAVEAVPVLLSVMRDYRLRNDRMGWNLTINAANAILRIDPNEMEPAQYLVDCCFEHKDDALEFGTVYSFILNLGDVMEPELRKRLEKPFSLDSPDYEVLNKLSKLLERIDAGKKEKEESGMHAKG